MSKSIKQVKQKLFQRSYAYLNKKQREVVLTAEGPLLVVAGAGSGKTTVLVDRITHLIKYGNAYYSNNSIAIDEDELEMLKNMAEYSDNFYPDAITPLLVGFAENSVPADRILAITFTNKAANEIKERLKKRLGKQGEGIWAGTFHSICVRLLKMFSKFIPYGNDFVIYDQDDCKKIITEMMKEKGINDEDIQPKYVLNIISKAKNLLQTPEEFEKSFHNSTKLKICSELYKSYQKRLTESNAMDFDDLIMQTVFLLQNCDEARNWCQNQFLHVMVDEYQDTNHAQYLMMRLIADGHRNIMVVGDDDQSIYKFRGAAVENILNFDKEYPDAKVIFLEQNYRSTKRILESANAVIENNVNRRGKKLWSDNDTGDHVRVVQLENQEKEAQYIAEQIHLQLRRNLVQYYDTAILYRTRAQSNALETALTKAGIPHRVLAGHRFYDHAEIKDILAYLRLIKNQKDFVSLSRVINSPRRGIGLTTVEKIKNISEQEQLPVFTVLQNAAQYDELKRSASKLQEFAQLIQYFVSFSCTNLPSRLIHEVINKTAYMDTLSGDENEEKRNNIEELLSSVTRFETENPDGTLSDYLEEVALVSEVDNMNDDENAVTMMTVHAAKGLEFGVVYIAGMEENIFPSAQSAGTESELEEERRLAYVAMTRAKYTLYLTCCHHRLMYGRTNYNKPSRFLDELPEDNIKKTLYVPEEKIDYDCFNPANFQRRVFSVSNFDERPKTPMNVPDPRQVIREKKPMKTYKKGERVKHTIFGNGTILNASKVGSDTLYEIQFDQVGIKKIMGTYAKLIDAE